MLQLRNLAYSKNSIGNSEIQMLQRSIDAMLQIDKLEVMNNLLSNAQL
jgi:hypothetical protein